MEITVHCQKLENDGDKIVQQIQKEREDKDKEFSTIKAMYNIYFQDQLSVIENLVQQMPTCQ